jgi:hypothetical protein
MPAPEPVPDLLKAANDISGKVFALWIAFLTVTIYLAISISTTNDIQLPLDYGVKLPLLGVSISPDAFYTAGPPMFRSRRRVA